MRPSPLLPSLTLLLLLLPPVALAAAPTCEAFAPGSPVTVARGGSLDFEGRCYDSDDNLAAIRWLVNGRPYGPDVASESPSAEPARQTPSFHEPGEHEVTLVAVDAAGAESSPVTWTVRVQDGGPTTPASPAATPPPGGGRETGGAVMDPAPFRFDAQAFYWVAAGTAGLIAAVVPLVLHPRKKKDEK